MKSATIDELAHTLKEAKRNGSPMPIFFLGAGASKTGGIPLASEIATAIVKRYSDSPKIKKLESKDKTYPNLMSCLSPDERNKLLQAYIDAAKINMTHIYLAQLLTQGFVDYILTVNFDNLMLRASALFNEFPATYDMAILRDLTTSTFRTKSIVYLHGQHHGLWLLNTEEEMEKVKDTIPPILNSIKSQRPWIFIGYSGEDPIFKHIKDLGRFDNGLYWVSYYDNLPSETVCKDLLEKPLTNAFIIKGYNADSFMITLNTLLELPKPPIIDKPFSSLRGMLDNINDVGDEEYVQDANERLEIAKRQANESVWQYEEGEVEPTGESNKSRKINLLKEEIIDLITQKKHSENQMNQIIIEAQRLQDAGINTLLAGLYSDWGIALGKEAEHQTGREAENLYQQAFDKFKKATDINPDSYEGYNNWGIAFKKFAKDKTGQEAANLYLQAFDKFKKAADINPDRYEAYHNWAIALGDIAKNETGLEAEKLYQQAFDKFKGATDVNHSEYEIFYNWGTTLGEFAQNKTGQEAENLYQQAFDKFKKATDINPNCHEAYNNWGAYLGVLAQNKTGQEAENLYQQAIDKFEKAADSESNDYRTFFHWGTVLGALAQNITGREAENLYRQAFDKFEKAADIQPDKYGVYHNWAMALKSLAQNKTGQQAANLYQQAVHKFQKSISLGGESYTLACLYTLQSDKKNALLYLGKSLENNEITVELVKNDADWKTYAEDDDFKEMLKTHTGIRK